MSYATTVLSDTPVGYWKFSETSGTSAADSSGNSHSSALTIGSAVTVGQAKIASQTSGSFLFPGGTASATKIAKTTAGLTTYPWYVTNTSMTLEVVVKTAATAAASTLCSIGTDGAQSPFIIICSTSKFEADVVGVVNGLKSLVPASATYAVSTVYHLALVIDLTAALATLYQNGVSVATASMPSETGVKNGTSSGTNIACGSDASPADTCFAGNMSDFAVYTQALSSTRVKAHYDALAAAIRRRVSSAWILAH